MTDLLSTSIDREKRIRAIADQCVKCGLCLPVCPTYQRTRSEAESPRGRITIARSLRDGIAPDASAQAHLDSCLACGACETACPSRVPYVELLVEVRALIGSHRRESLLRRAARAMLERPRTLAWMRWLRPFLLRQRTKSFKLNAALSKPPALLSDIAPTGNAADRIALFNGCASAALEHEALNAATHLLTQCRWQVVQMPSQCCGALARHSGDISRADELGARLAARLSSIDAALCTSIVSGCASQYTQLAGDGMTYRDAMSLLWSRREHLRFRASTQTVALHLPCTQRMLPDSIRATQNLLGLVPGLKVIVLPTRGRCCGGAGTYFLDHKHTAEQLDAVTANDARNIGADLLLGANIGCRVQLSKAISLPMLHPLEFLSGLLEPES